MQASGLDTYPDVSVVCGRAEMDNEDKDALVNPLIVVEVTSPSSAAYDRGAKLQHYRRIPTLQQVLLVAHGEQRVDVWTRVDATNWSSQTFGPDATLRLTSLDCDLTLAAIYRNPLPRE